MIILVILVSYRCDRDGGILGGQWLVAAHGHARGRVLVHTHGIVDALLDVNI
jgi:hypothetical protein